MRLKKTSPDKISRIGNIEFVNDYPTEELEPFYDKSWTINNMELNKET